MNLLLLIHAAATVFMFGVILTVQIVHYPLFSIVGDLRFVSYHKEHMHRIGRVVVVPMLVELVSAAALLVWQPEGVPNALTWLGLVLVAGIWISTWFVQVPRHNDLTRGFDSVAHASLVRSNWLRTVTWGLRSVLVLIMIYLAGPRGSF
jgi:hypothetical protein